MSDAANRLINLKAILKNDERFKGKQVRLAEALGRKPSFVNDLLSGKRKSFGEKLARSIEEELELPARWLDRPPGEADTMVREGAVTYVVSAWPFSIDRKRFDALPEKVRWKIDGMIELTVREWEQARTTRPRKRKGAG